MYDAPNGRLESCRRRHFSELPARRITLAFPASSAEVHPARLYPHDAPRSCFRGHFLSQLATTRKSLRAAPPRSEFMDTYQPRLLGTGPVSTSQMC